MFYRTVIFRLMPRSFTYSALTLRVKASGESNREAWFLTAEEGVLKATVFGGPKSKLRSHVAPFHEGKLWIYYDPVRDSRKVNDFDVLSYRTGIRELYERTITASAVAETVLSSQGGGGSWQEAAELAGSVFDALDTAGEAACSLIAVYFFWHWADILGVRPDISVCASCGRAAKDSDSLWYSARKEALLCESCIENCIGRMAHNADSSFRLTQKTRQWLTETAKANISSIQEPADAESLKQAKALAKAVLAGTLGKWLPTWDAI